MYLYVILSNVLSGFLVIVYVKLFVEKYNKYKDLYIIVKCLVLVLDRIYKLVILIIKRNIRIFLFYLLKM